MSSPRSRRGIFSRRAGNSFSKKSAYASLDVTGERKDQSENYNKIVILKSTREREKERERERERERIP